MQIRKCQSDEDIQQLAKLANEIWHEYFIDIISFEQIEYMVEKFQSYPALKKAIEEEQYTYFLAFEETELIGYCGVKPEKERLFLSKLYLRKDKRGQGLASYLLEEAIKFAKEQNKQARDFRISMQCRQISVVVSSWMIISWKRCYHKKRK